MKARIKPRDDKAKENLRYSVRRNLKNITRLVFIEEFGFGASGTKIPRIMERAEKTLQKYDALYPDVREEQEKLVLRLLREKIDCKPTRGSGYKVELSAEHTVFTLSVLLSLRKEKKKFGKKRMKQFLDSLNYKINYYNNTFAGTDGAGYEVIRDRLKRYGSIAD